jgi:hypothetical protein
MDLHERRAALRTALEAAKETSLSAAARAQTTVRAAARGTPQPQPGRKPGAHTDLRHHTARPHGVRSTERKPMSEQKKGTNLPPQSGDDDSPGAGTFDVNRYIKQQAERGAARPNPLTNPKETGA